MRRTVLLIDDNAVQAATRQAILRGAGHLVETASDPGDALRQMQSGGFADVALVITDHIMPVMNGSEFVRGLRKTHPQVPVMVISGLDEAEAEYEGLNVHFCVKPVHPDTLLANVRNLLEARQRGAA